MSQPFYVVANRGDTGLLWAWAAKGCSKSSQPRLKYLSEGLWIDGRHKTKMSTKILSNLDN